MIHVTVKRIDGLAVAECQFYSDAEAAEWINAKVAAGAFGKNERWVHEQDLVILGEEKAKAIEVQRTGGPDEEHVMFKFAPNFTIEKKDITCQVEINHKALSYLKETDWYVVRFVEAGIKIPDDVKTKRMQARDSIAL